MSDTYAAERKRRQRAQTNRDPGAGPLPAAARMDLEGWRGVARATVDWLVRDYGTDGALRILNGPEPVGTPAPVPFDPSLLAPPGAVGRPADRRGARARLFVDGLL